MHKLNRIPKENFNAKYIPEESFLEHVYWVYAVINREVVWNKKVKIPASCREKCGFWATEDMNKNVITEPLIDIVYSEYIDDIEKKEKRINLLI